MRQFAFRDIQNHCHQVNIGFEFLRLTRNSEKNVCIASQASNRQILRRIDRHERIVVGRTGKSREVPLLLLWGQER